MNDKIINQHSKNLRLMEHNIPKPDMTNKATGQIFRTKSKELLQSIYDGVKHLEEVNKETNTSVDVELDMNKSILSITINELGTFQVTVDESKHEIVVFSPVSYGQVYVYLDNQWKSVLDGHDIFQLLATEINAYCQGYPRF